MFRQTRLNCSAAAKVGRAATSQNDYYDSLAKTMVAQMVQDNDEVCDIDAPLPATAATAATAAQMASRLVTTEDAGKDGQDGTGADGTDAASVIDDIDGDDGTSASDADDEDDVIIGDADIDAEEEDETTLTDFLLQSKSPKEIVKVLDDFIVGQLDAKKAVAVALRNRWRRQQLPEDMRAEIIPKNILMIGPTGCGKTEISRRLSSLSEAPFIKVEATKFTEVGFHGRDVDMIIRDLVDSAIALTKKQRRRKAEKMIREVVEEKILAALIGSATVESNQHFVYLEYLRNGQLDGQEIEVEVPAAAPPGGAVAIDANSMQPVGLNELIGRIGKVMNSPKATKKTMKVKDARKLLTELEMEHLLDSEDVHAEAVENAQQNGIVFIDEIDKICSGEGDRLSGDASAEGVQRDLLPLIEGSTISTKYGNIETDFILFICSGAFHQCKPADLLPELQGRLPVRVELEGLGKDELYRILTEPTYNLIKQQVALMSTEGVTLSFTDDAIQRIAEVAAEINTNIENIGARRLNTVLERIMEEISFAADERKGQEFEVGVELVDEKIGDMVDKIDLSKFVL